MGSRSFLFVTVILCAVPALAGGKKDIFSPSRGVVCDRAGGACYDAQGVSVGLTGQYLGQPAAERLSTRLGEVEDFDRTVFRLSNGVTCDTKTMRCEKASGKKARKITKKIFGKK